MREDYTKGGLDKGFYGSDGVKDPNVYTLSDMYNDENKMQQFFERLSQYRKSTLVKMSNSTSIRKTLLADFPFMAKM